MKHSLLLLTAVFAVFAFFVACGGSEGSGDGGSGGIYGHVTDFATGEDVIHAKVSLSPGGNTTLTGSDGIYEFRDLASGDYQITVSKEGYNKFQCHYYEDIEVKDKMVVYDIQLVQYKGCETKSCGHGICEAESDYDHKCICDDGYFNDGNTSTKECISPCDPNLCGHGTCEASDYRKYKCICDDGYFNDGGDSSGYFGKCISPCDPNPCGNEICESTGVDTYECKCSEGYWDGSTCGEFPLCDTKNITPCMDANYMWSARASQDMDWDSAISYCDNLVEGDFDDWSLPSTEVLTNFYNGNGSSKLGDTGYFWSSKSYDDDKAYLVRFSDGNVVKYDKSDINSVRCVRW